MYNIAVYNNKGGVGKTTIASALVYVAKEYFKTATNVIDADNQRNLMQVVSHGNWDGGEIYEDGLITAYNSLAGIVSNKLCIIDCPPEYDFISKLDGVPIDKWIIPIKGRFSIDGLASVLGQLKKCGRANEEVIIVSNMNTKESVYGRVQFEEARKLGAELYPKPIHRNIAFEKAEDSYQYVFDMPYISRSLAVETLKKFAQDMIAW